MLITIFSLFVCLFAVGLILINWQLIKSLDRTGIGILFIIIGLFGAVLCACIKYAPV